MNQSEFSNFQVEPINVESFQFAAQSAGLGIWDVKLTQPMIISLDDRCKELSGLAKDSTPTCQSVIQSIHNDDRAAVEAAVKQALASSSNESRNITYRTINKNDGNIQWVKLIGKGYFDNSCIPYRFSGIAMDVTAEMRAKEKAPASDNLAQIAVKGTGIGLFHINMVNNEIDYSPAFAVILTGENIQKLNRQSFINHIHPADMETRKIAYEAALQSGDLYYEARTIWDDGTIHWIRTVGTYSFDAEGNPLSFSGTVQNITEKRQKEQELKTAQERFTQVLRQNEEMFRNVTSTSPTGLWMSDEEGKLTYLNKTLTDWTGMPYEMLLGNGWASAVIDEDRPKAAAAFGAAIASRSHYDVEFRIHKGTGEIIWCRAAGDPYYNEDGTYAGYAGFCMDINEKMLASNNLRVSEERLRAIIEQSPVAIGLLNGSDMIVTTANEAMLRIWGKNDSIIGLRFSDALPELKGQPFMMLLHQVYDTGKPYYGYNSLARLEYNGQLKDGYFDFVFTPLRNANGLITGVMAIATEVTSQVLARKALEESELFARNIIHNSPVAEMVFSGEDMIIETINENMLEMLGRSASILGKPFREALPELVNTPLPERLQNVLATGETFNQPEEKIDLMRYGKPYTGYYNYIYKALSNTSGEFYGVMVTATEVTEQVNARMALEVSQNRLRSLVESAPFPIGVYTGKEMRIELANQSILEIWAKGEDVINKRYREILPELENQEIFQQLDGVFNTGIPFHKRNQRVDIDTEGKIKSYYFNYSFTPLYNADGQVYGIMNTAADVTDLAFAKQQVEQAEESLRGAIELADLGTWNIDLATGILDYSKRLRRWFGFSEDEVITIEKAYSPILESDRHLVQESMTRAVNPEIRSLYDVEYTASDKITGRERIIHAQGKAFFNEKGEAYKVTGTAQDVTKQRQVQLALEQEVQQRTEELQAVNEELTATNEELFNSNERLVHSNEELEQYAYVASHDLQEPLRKIRIFSDKLASQQDLTENNKPWVEKIRKSSERMSGLIQDLLEFSRLLKTETIMRPVDITTVCKAVVHDFELSIQEKGAEVKIGNLPVIETVGLQMNQLFYNLLSNALKFSSPFKKPLIEVSSTVVSHSEITKYIHRPNSHCTYYRITFADNGIGFEVKYAEQIFEVFKRLHGRDIYPGSGIGLALCRRIVTNHHGYLYAESTLGKGSAFHIILPEKSVESSEK